MEDPEPLPVDYLLTQKTCCGSGCTNCPYVPRATTGAVDVDVSWVRFKLDNPGSTYEDFLKKNS